MRRFYCPHLIPTPTEQERGVIDLDPQESRHAATVVRVAVGDGIELFDGRGMVADATVVGVRRDRVSAEVTRMSVHPRVQPRVEVATALPKGPRVAAMVQTLSQTGADVLVPLQPRHAAVPAPRMNHPRLQRVAIEAAKQCRRPHLLEIESASCLEEVLARPCDLRLIGTTDGSGAGDPWSRLGGAQRVMILVGPEGGWTDAELACAREAGAVAWAFGPYVMRIETACGAAVSIVRYLGRSDG